MLALIFIYCRSQINQFRYVVEAPLLPNSPRSHFALSYDLVIREISFAVGLTYGLLDHLPESYVDVWNSGVRGWSGKASRFHFLRLKKDRDAGETAKPPLVSDNLSISLMLNS